MSYNVVFEGTGRPNSNYLGIRTWTQFESHEDYQKWRKSTDNKDFVVAEDVTTDEARNLIRKTSGRAFAWAALIEGAQGGNMDMVLKNATFATMRDGTHVEFQEELKKIYALLSVLRFWVPIGGDHE